VAGQRAVERFSVRSCEPDRAVIKHVDFDSALVHLSAVVTKRPLTGRERTSDYNSAAESANEQRCAAAFSCVELIPVNITRRRELTHALSDSQLGSVG
jgi:hypothetical protein